MIPLVTSLLDRLPLHRSSRQGDICIITVPRSGLTWLLEMFDSLRYTRCVKEIFGPWNVSRMMKYFQPRARYLALNKSELEGVHQYLYAVQQSREFRLPYNPLNPKFKLNTSLNVIVVSKLPNMAHWIENVTGWRIL